MQFHLKTNIVMCFCHALAMRLVRNLHSHLNSIAQVCHSCPCYWKLVKIPIGRSSLLSFLESQCFGSQKLCFNFISKINIIEIIHLYYARTKEVFRTETLLFQSQYIGISPSAASPQLKRFPTWHSKIVVGHHEVGVVVILHSALLVARSILQFLFKQLKKR